MYHKISFAEETLSARPQPGHLEFMQDEINYQVPHRDLHFRDDFELIVVEWEELI
jgi:hypothetical protein